MRIDISNMTYGELRGLVEKMRLEKLDIFVQKLGSSSVLSATSFVEPPTGLG